MVYLDDLLVFSIEDKDHLVHVRKRFYSLKTYSNLLKEYCAKKWRKEVDYLLFFSRYRPMIWNQKKENQAN